MHSSELFTYFISGGNSNANNGSSPKKSNKNQQHQSPSLGNSLLKTQYKKLGTNSPNNPHQKLLLSTPYQQEQLNESGDVVPAGSGSSTNASVSASVPAMNMSFAYTCLKTAAFFVAENIRAQKCNHNKLNLLKADISLKQAFVALHLDDHTSALAYAKDLLTMQKNNLTNIPSGYITLARLYAGEALLHLDHISEAIRIFDPKDIQDFSFSFSGSNNSNSGGNNTSNEDNNDNR